jgi:hypothetical protein
LLPITSRVSAVNQAAMAATFFETHIDGTMLEALRQETEPELADSLQSLKTEEAAVMALLTRRLAAEAGEMVVSNTCS